jgi:hypothetical protein
MTNTITPGTCRIIVTSIKKDSTKVPFPSPAASKMKGMENGIVWKMVLCCDMRKT